MPPRVRPAMMRVGSDFNEATPELNAKLGELLKSAGHRKENHGDDQSQRENCHSYHDVMLFPRLFLERKRWGSARGR